MNAKHTAKLADVMTRIEADALEYYSGNTVASAECDVVDHDEQTVYLSVVHMELGGIAREETHDVSISDLESKTAEQIFLDLK